MSASYSDEPQGFFFIRLIGMRVLKLLLYSDNIWENIQIDNYIVRAIRYSSRARSSSKSRRRRSNYGTWCFTNNTETIHTSRYTNRAAHNKTHLELSPKKKHVQKPLASIGKKSKRSTVFEDKYLLFWFIHLNLNEINARCLGE